MIAMAKKFFRNIERYREVAAESGGNLLLCFDSHCPAKETEEEGNIRCTCNESIHAMIDTDSFNSVTMKADCLTKLIVAAARKSGKYDTLVSAEEAEFQVAALVVNNLTNIGAQLTEDGDGRAIVLLVDEYKDDGSSMFFPRKMFKPPKNPETREDWQKKDITGVFTNDTDFAKGMFVKGAKATKKKDGTVVPAKPDMYLPFFVDGDKIANFRRVEIFLIHVLANSDYWSLRGVKEITAYKLITESKRVLFAELPDAPFLSPIAIIRGLAKYMAADKKKAIHSFMAYVLHKVNILLPQGPGKILKIKLIFAYLLV